MSSISFATPNAIPMVATTSTKSVKPKRVFEKALGSNHPDVAQSLNNLAGLYDSQGKHAEAEPLYQRSLAICEKALGPDHPHTRLVRSNLDGLRTSHRRRFAAGIRHGINRRLTMGPFRNTASEAITFIL